MKILKIDHIGVAVNSINNKKNFWTNILGLKFIGTEKVKDQGVITGFLSVGESKIELIESILPNGTIAKHIEKRGEGFQHIAFQVYNINDSITKLKKNGVLLINDIPRIGANGSKIIFIHPKFSGGILVELCEF